MIKILIDGDSCPVINITEKIASEKQLECHVYCDTSRIIQSDYSNVHIVDKGFNSADFAIVSNCTKNDIVITNDSGLAAMILSMNGFVMTTYGMEYTKENIMYFLNNRYFRQNIKRKTNCKKISGILPKNKIKTMDSKDTLKYIISKAERNV